MTYVEMMVASLKFDKKTLAKIGKSDNYSMPAIVWLFISALVSGIVGSLGYAPSVPGMEALEGLAGLINGFIIGLLTTFVLAWVFSIVLKIFGGTSSTMAVIRIMGATAIWTILGSILSIVGIGFIGFIGFIALLFGISAYSGKGMFIVFIALILSYILIVVIILFAFIGLFAALFALIGA
ncbi:MAG: hypothetical protein INQ03_03325 [Candidatus Heimdallarchaeota archaeon]|nr:hypothetical protein [Candidatus Heimdallarchaeota archaeon]